MHQRATHMQRYSKRGADERSRQEDLSSLSTRKLCIRHSARSEDGRQGCYWSAGILATGRRIQVRMTRRACFFFQKEIGWYDGRRNDYMGLGRSCGANLAGAWHATRPTGETTGKKRWVNMAENKPDLWRHRVKAFRTAIGEVGRQRLGQGPRYLGKRWTDEAIQKVVLDS